MEKIPILRMGEFLLVTIQVDMHDRLGVKPRHGGERLSAQREHPSSRGHPCRCEPHAAAELLHVLVIVAGVIVGVGATSLVGLLL